MGDPFDNRGIAGYLDISPHSPQFADVNKTVFENGFRYHAGAVGNAHQHHELRLHIGRKPWIWLGFYIDTVDRARFFYMDAISVNVYFSPGKPQFVYQGSEVIRLRIE